MFPQGTNEHTRMTRRELLRAAGAGAVGLALAACGASSSQSSASGPGKKPASVSGTVTLAFYLASEEWTKTFKKRVVEVFQKKQPKIKLNVQVRPGQDYFTKLQTQFAGGAGPDVTVANMDWTVPAASRGMFVNVKPYMDRDGIVQSDYWYPFDREWGWQGGIYAVLLYAGGQVTYINKDLLKQAGLDFPKPDWTWDDLVEYGRKLTDPKKQQWGITFDAITPPYWSAAFIQEHGGSVLNSAKDKCTLTSPEAQQALQFLADLIFKHKVMPNPSAMQGQENPFLTGKVGIMFGGTWEETAIRQSGFDWDFAHMPLDPQTKKRSVQEGSNGWAMLSTTKNKEASWEVMKFLVGPDGQKGIMTLGLPVLKDLVDSIEFKRIHQPQNIEVPVSDFTKSGHGYYVTPDANEWWGKVTDQLSPIFSGDKTVPQATRATCQAVDKVFAQRKSNNGK